MNRVWLFRKVGLICAFTASAAVGLPTVMFAEPATAPTHVGFGAPPVLAQSASSSRSNKYPAVHVVRRGETLSAIGRRYGMSVAAIRQENGLRGDTIRVGQQLIVSAEPRLKRDQAGDLVPDVRAEAAIIYNPETGQVLWEENSLNQRSIASITKVMTVTVFLEGDPDLGRQVVVERADVRNASVTYIRAGETVSVYDLLHLTLIASDNAAARVLARVSPYGSDAFIDRMNEKAAELGLTSTEYADPSGLLSANVSSAYDMARLISYVSGDDRISSVMRKQYHTATVGRRSVKIHSTNQLVMKGDVDVLGGKTGFIRKAGYCLATLLRLPGGGPQIAVVVLGAQSNAGRFMETRQLFNWLADKADVLFAGATVEAATLDLATLTH